MKCFVHMTIMLYEYLGELKDMRFIEGRGIKQLHGVSSVSYTHLDVYKRQFLTRAGEVLNRLYEESLAQNPNPYEMKDEIFCNVLRCRYLSGELEKERYILEYKAYCDYVFAHDEMDRDLSLIHI